MPPTNSPRKWILLGRLSPSPRQAEIDLTDEGIPVGLEDQVRRMRDCVIQRGGEVFKVIKTPDLSAYITRRVILPDGRTVYRVFRPDLVEAMEHMTAGRATGLMALDLDRAFRDPMDLRDLINLIEHSPHDLVASSTNASLELAKGKDPFDAEVRVLVANKSSKDTARRVSAARERDALAGKFGGGRRPYGFEADGITVRESEKAIIAEACNEVLAGVPLRMQCRTLNDRGVPTSDGKRWVSPTLRAILLRPRTAGYMVHKGRIVARAPWAPLVTEDVWRTVVAVLTDPERPVSVGAAPRYLGSGLFLCRCGHRLSALVSKTKALAYRCEVRGEGHVVRNMANVDAVVVDATLARLQRADLADVLEAPTETGGVDVNALRAEVEMLRRLKAEAAAMFAGGDIDRIEFSAMKTRNDAKLTAAMDALSAVAAKVSPLTRLVGVEDPRAVWEGMSLGSRRAAIKALATVTIQPTKKGSRFDPRSVVIRWSL